jgi:hypothetical protein
MAAKKHQSTLARFCRYMSRYHNVTFVVTRRVIHALPKFLEREVELGKQVFFADLGKLDVTPFKSNLPKHIKIHGKTIETLQPMSVRLTLTGPLKKRLKKAKLKGQQNDQPTA